MPKCEIHHIAFPEGQKCIKCATQAQQLSPTPKRIKSRPSPANRSTFSPRTFFVLLPIGAIPGYYLANIFTSYKEMFAVFTIPLSIIATYTLFAVSVVPAWRLLEKKNIITIDRFLSWCLIFGFLAGFVPIILIFVVKFSWDLLKVAAITGLGTGIYALGLGVIHWVVALFTRTTVTVPRKQPPLVRAAPTILAVMIAIFSAFPITSVWPKINEGIGGHKEVSDIDHFKSLCKKDAGEFITERINNVTSIAQLQPPAQCPKRDIYTQVADVPEWVLLCSDNWLAYRPSNLGLLPTSHYSVFETQLHSGENGVLERIANHQYQKHASYYEKHKYTYSEAEKGQLSSRYGYTWKFFRSDSFPKRIAGIQVDIIDTQEKKVIAYKREYVLYRENRTPAQLCAELDRTGNFVQRVLRPPFHEDFERTFTSSIRENKELFEGVKSFYVHDFEEAKRLLIPLALGQNPDAAIYLGQTVRANKENHWPPYLSPIKLFKTAADAGHPLGMHLYGDQVIYTNKKEGLAYIRRAAENGWLQSILSMSNYYNNGSRYYYSDSKYNYEGNIEVDRVKALAWLLLIKEHPEKIRQDSTNLDTELYVAEIGIQNILSKLSQEQIKEATKIAKEWTIGHSL